MPKAPEALILFLGDAPCGKHACGGDTNEHSGMHTMMVTWFLAVCCDRLFGSSVVTIW